MNNLNIEISEFLQPFFNPTDNVCIRLFSDVKNDGFKGQKIDIPMARVEQYVEILREHNNKNRGVFFVVNYGGNEDKDITRINAQFVENDKLSIEEQYKKLMDFPLEPSLIVKTQKSLHSYWLIKNGSVDKFRNIQTKLAKYFDGDKTIVNESRVLRIPGFYHRKNEPVMVTCIKYNPEIRYTQEELLEHLPKDETEIKNTPKLVGVHKGISLVTKRCLFIKHCKENSEKLSEHDWYSMITNLAVLEDGEKVIHELSTNYPQYSKIETDSKIQHFLKSNTKPINCKTIYEKGFKCPRLENNECNCKSPASFIYIPFDTDDLEELLKEVPISNVTTKDIKSANKFISDYMFNIDETEAEPFILSEIRNYFRFKGEFVRTLIKKYKEVYKSYKLSKKTDNYDSMPWYESSDKGVKFIPGVLATHLSSAVKAFYGAEDFYVYENGVYKNVKDLIISRIIREHMIVRFVTMNSINDTFGQWQMLMYKPLNQLNPNPYVINLKNGLYNVLEDKLKPHTPEYYSTVQINAVYDKEAKCEQFLKYLSDSFGDEEIRLVQEILGYLLIPVNKAQKSFVFVGAGNAGKSTLLSVAQEILLGRENVSNVAWQNLNDRFKTAELFGKLANIFADLPSKNIDDNGMFKSITGEDYITVEKKNKAPFSFKPYAKLVFSCNDIPKNYGDRSTAFYRRLIIIRFDKAIPMDKRDTSLMEKLIFETNGIFMWALEGLKRLIQNDYVFSETDRTKYEVEKYRIDSNSVLSFVENYCEIDNKLFVEIKELYARYKEYCNESGLNPVSQIRFGKEIRENYENIITFRENVSRRTVYKGIGFNEI